MAIAKTRSSRRRFVVVLLILAGLAAAWIVWGEGLRRFAGAGVAYGARVGCSCRFVAGRSLSDCAKDKLEGMELVSLSEDVAAKSVTASIPLIASETARLNGRFGCQLEPWDD